MQDESIVHSTVNELLLAQKGSCFSLSTLPLSTIILNDSFMTVGLLIEALGINLLLKARLSK